MLPVIFLWLITFITLISTPTFRNQDYNPRFKEWIFSTTSDEHEFSCSIKLWNPLPRTVNSSSLEQFCSNYLCAL